MPSSVGQSSETWKSLAGIVLVLALLAGFLISVSYSKQEISVVDRARTVPESIAGFYHLNGRYEWPDKMVNFQWHIEHTLGAKTAILEHDLMDGNAGMTDSTNRLIAIDETLPIEDQFYTLAHEAAHLLQLPFMQKSEREVFAELVAIRVCQKWGLVTDKATAPYIGQYKLHLDIAEIYKDYIDWSATVIAGF